MRLLLRRTALVVASRRSRAAVVTTEAANATAARSSRPAAPAIAMKNADDASPLDLDLAAASFSLSPSAALGLDGAGAAADASLGPRVDHLIVGQEDSEEEEEEEEEGEGEEGVGDLVSFVASRSNLSREHALALLEIGAVWWCPVPPPPPRSYGSRAESSTPSAIAARAAAEERHRSGRERHGRGMHLFKPRRASFRDNPPRGSYVRVHVRPKRYFDLRADREQQMEEGGGGEGDPPLLPAPLSTVGYDARAWARRLVSLSPGFAILNKPPCVPSVPTVENGVEHALSGAAAGIAETLRKRRSEEEVPLTAGGGGGGDETSTPLPPQRPPPRHRLKGPQATGEAATGGLAAAHRLDHGASGVLAIGRCPRFVAGFQELSKRGRVAKVYRAALAVTAAAETAAASSSSSSPAPPPPPSLPRPGDTLVHWAEVNARPHGAPPRTLMFEGPSEEGVGEGEGDGSGSGEGEERRSQRGRRARCELRIVSMKKVPLLPSGAEALGVAAAAAEEEGGSRKEQQQEVWEACILLITGRTHQIRAQMAAVGFPLLGDVLYGTADYSCVEAPRRRKKNSDDKEAAAEEEDGESEKSPPLPTPLPLDRPIALHAARLASSGRHALRVFGRDPAIFDAGAPWWRAGLGEEDERDLERALDLRAEVEAAAAAKEREGEGKEESSDEDTVLVA